MSSGGAKDIVLLNNKKKGRIHTKRKMCITVLDLQHTWDFII